jgi:hypothetical protein
MLQLTLCVMISMSLGTYYSVSLVYIVCICVSSDIINNYLEVEFMICYHTGFRTKYQRYRVYDARS